MASSVSLVKQVKTSVFAFTSNVAADDTVVIGDITYTFKASPSAAFEVDVGTDLDTSISNLAAAINHTGTAGTTYGTGTTQHPDVSATADLANDEIDLSARVPGIHSESVRLAATSPGANDITANAVALGLISGGTNGAGTIQAWALDLINNNQINSEVLSHLKVLTEAAD